MVLKIQVLASLTKFTHFLKASKALKLNTLWGCSDGFFTAVTNQIPCILAIYITIHNYQNYSYEAATREQCYCWGSPHGELY